MTPEINTSGTSLGRYRWLRYAPPAAALSVAWLLQVVVVTDVGGTALVERFPETGPGWWFGIAALFGVAVATSLEAGAAYLMALYDRHLIARDTVWQLRAGMVLYVAVSAFVIHWWLGYRGLPEIVAVVLALMSASALWLWSRGARWAQRREMKAAGQIDPALPRLPTVSKVMHPIRWIITIYLISWNPVSTTDEARERYAEWSRRSRWTSLKPADAEAGSSSSASGSVTSTSPRPTTRRSRRTAGAPGAALSPRGGSTSTASSTGSVEPSMNGTARPIDSRRLDDDELISIALQRSLQNASQNRLISELNVGKARARRLHLALQSLAAEEPTDG